MGLIIKDRNPLISFILTDYGKKQLSLGKLSFDNYAFGDSDIDYNTADINSSILKPVSNFSDFKSLLYKKDQSCFYAFSNENIESSDIVEDQDHVFANLFNDNHIVTIDNKFVGIEGRVIGSETAFILNVKFDNPIINSS